MAWDWDAYDHRSKWLMEENFQHRSVDRGCGIDHYGFKSDCPRCQETKRKDDEAYKKYKEEQEQKKRAGDHPA